MLIHKAALIAGALVVSGVATMAQAHDQAGSGADSIVADTYRNQRALQDQAENNAYLAQFRRPAPGMTISNARITQRDALDIARAQGVVDVEGVQQRGGVWMVDGTNLFGSNLTVHVNSSGQVLDVQRS
jgi:hypothetical protein